MLRLVVLFLVGCGPKPSAPTAAVASEAPTATDPFLASVLSVGIQNWSPTGNSDFRWTSVTFRPEGAVEAHALLRAGDEEINCLETGTWKVDQTHDARSGILDLTIEKTECPNRENGLHQRVELTYGPDGSQTVSAR